MLVLVRLSSLIIAIISAFVLVSSQGATRSRDPACARILSEIPRMHNLVDPEPRFIARIRARDTGVRQVLDLSEINELLNRSVRVLEPSMRLPMGLQIYVYSRSWKSPLHSLGYVEHLNELRLTTHFGDESLDEASRRQNAEAINFHEIAHAYFSFNLRQLPEWREYLGAVEHFSNMMIEDFFFKRRFDEVVAEKRELLDVEIRRGLDELQEGYNQVRLKLNQIYIDKAEYGRTDYGPEAERLKQQLIEIEEQIDTFLKSVLDPETMEMLGDFQSSSKNRNDTWVYMYERVKNHPTSRVTSPYNELWAGLMAVVFVNDPQAVSRAISKESRHAHLRDFSRHHEMGSLSESVMSEQGVSFRVKERDFLGRVISWDELTGLDNEFGPHNILPVVRRPLWEIYDQSQEYRRDPGSFLSKVFFDVLLPEIKERLRDPSLKELSSRQMNQRLLKRIQEEFRISN